MTGLAIIDTFPNCACGGATPRCYEHSPTACSVMPAAYVEVLEQERELTREERASLHYTRELALVRVEEHRKAHPDASPHVPDLALVADLARDGARLQRESIAKTQAVRAELLGPQPEPAPEERQAWGEPNYAEDDDQADEEPERTDPHELACPHGDDVGCCLICTPVGRS